jgi:gamma-tubulin complex component 2
MKELFNFLLDKAAVPYFSILRKWIFSGVLEDPFTEFFISENRQFRKENIELDLNDRYWEERFTFKDEMIPIFLEKQKHKVLHAGKYLFVIRECGRLDIKNPMEESAG